jgi:putative transposase
MGEVLGSLLGGQARGLSASTIGRLKAQWADELKTFRGSPLAQDRWVYLWTDGIHFGIRADNAPLCALVVIGASSARSSSTQSWREVLPN